MFGLFPRNGTIAVSSEAGIMVIDQDAKTAIIAHIHQVTVDCNPYEGLAMRGVSEVVIATDRVLREGG